MPKQPVKGTKQVLLELPEQLVRDGKDFAQSRGESFKEVVIQALRRHMAFPPPPPPPVVPPPLPPIAPLPPVPAATQPVAKKGKK